MNLLMEDKAMEKTCANCYYCRGKNCTIMHSPIDGCWADEIEARRRVTEIKKYIGGNVDTVQKNSNRIYKRPAIEKLDESFMPLYKDGLNDKQIAKELNVSNVSVLKYRQGLELPVNINRKQKAL